MTKKPTQKVDPIRISLSGMYELGYRHAEEKAGNHGWAEGYQAGFLAAITLNRKVDDTCELCGASPMTAKCNNAGCEDK